MERESILHIQDASHLKPFCRHFVIDYNSRPFSLYLEQSDAT